MPPLVWVAIAVSTGFHAGFTLRWPILLLLSGAAACAVSARIIPSATLLYFAAAALFAWNRGPPRSAFARHASANVGWSASARDRAGAAIDTAFGEDAPLARALLIADQRDLSPELKRSFADAGVVHMLAIAGLHIAILAGTVALALSVCGAPSAVTTTGPAIVACVYVYVLGFPPAALRAAAMLVAITLGRLCQRYCTPWSTLALGALIPLVVPETVLEVGYQLSVVGMAAVIGARVLSARTRIARLRGLRHTVAHSLVTSLLATTVTAPIVAVTFGRLSFIGPVTNLVADPILALAQPILFIALVVALVSPHSAAFIAGAAHPLLMSFEWSARTAASVPYSAAAVTPTAVVTLLGAIGAAALVVACASRFRSRPVLLAAGAVCAMLWLG